MPAGGEAHVELQYLGPDLTRVEYVLSNGQHVKFTGQRVDRPELDAVVMIFDSPADPRDYTWRSTWFAEHQNESTLAFFATGAAEFLGVAELGIIAGGGSILHRRKCALCACPQAVWQAIVGKPGNSVSLGRTRNPG